MPRRKSLCTHRLNFIEVVIMMPPLYQDSRGGEASTLISHRTQPCKQIPSCCVVCEAVKWGCVQCQAYRKHSGAWLSPDHRAVATRHCAALSLAPSAREEVRAAG